MGRVLAVTGQPAAASVRFEQALSIDPGNVRARRLRGSNLIHSGRPAEGRAVMLGELHLDPRGREAATSRFHIAVSHYYEGDYGAAAEAAERCIAAYPGLVLAYYVLAASLGQVGRREEADAALRTCIEAYPAVAVRTNGANGGPVSKDRLVYPRPLQLLLHALAAELADRGTEE